MHSNSKGKKGKSSKGSAGAQARAQSPEASPGPAAAPAAAAEAAAAAAALTTATGAVGTSNEPQQRRHAALSAAVNVLGTAVLTARTETAMRLPGAGGSERCVSFGTTRTREIGRESTAFAVRPANEHPSHVPDNQRR